jgi:hypothetical protein
MDGNMRGKRQHSDATTTDRTRYVLANLAKSRLKQRELEIVQEKLYEQVDLVGGRMFAAQEILDYADQLDESVDTQTEARNEAETEATAFIEAAATIDNKSSTEVAEAMTEFAEATRELIRCLDQQVNVIEMYQMGPNEQQQQYQAAMADEIRAATASLSSAEKAEKNAKLKKKRLNTPPAAGGKRKSRRTRKSKKSRKGKTQKKRGQSTRRR